MGCYSQTANGAIVEMAMEILVLITPPSEMEKVGVFWKIQHKCCRIGTKPVDSLDVDDDDLLPEEVLLGLIDCESTG